MKKIISAIITYNPDIKRLNENISHIINQVEEVIIIDNNSKNYKSIEKLINFYKDKYSKINIIKNEENNGIAYALNQGLKYGKKRGYDWLLTLDQDSICDVDMIKYMESALSNIEINNVAIIAPNIIDENKQFQIEIVNSDIEYPTVVITSGSLTNIEKALKVGGFLNDLFIDYVDHEFCLRLRRNLYDVVRVNSSKLYHELGEIKTHNLLWKQVTTTNHSALRRYYYYRNSIYVHKNYRKLYPEWCKKDIFREIKAFVGILLYESDKINKVRYILKGIEDGFKGNLGKFNGL